ncbi:MAG: SDR family oxidoreductase [Hyphomicrobiales bacterium]|nr:SDR family oxidoreductase [Hyphomicrobiales bacterium]
MSHQPPKPVAIVTAAGSGMGAACARRLAAGGYAVALLSSSGKAEALAQELGGVAVTGSNLEPGDLARLVDRTVETFGGVDVLVNSAGHGPKGELLDLTDDDWHRGMDVYLMNVVRTVRLVTPHLLARGKGAIVNISTYAAFEPESFFPTSGVFRAGLAAFTKLYADRYAADGIRINNVLPGFIDSLPEKEPFRQRIPMGRYGRVAEIADTVAFLVSDGAGYITGQNIRVDGGITRAV